MSQLGLDSDLENWAALTRSTRVGKNFTMIFDYPIIILKQVVLTIFLFESKLP